MTRIGKNTVAVVAVGIALLFVALCIHTFLPPVPHHKLNQLTKGITRARAEKILGRPGRVVVPSGYGAETWRYQVRFRFGWVDVFFDDQERLIFYNYERF